MVAVTWVLPNMTPFVAKLPTATLVGERHGLSDGVPLILVHGFGGSRHDWHRIVGALQNERPVIVYDQRGFGDSAGEADSPFSHADDLIALLDALEIDCADVAGVSLGGATVMGCAITAPERVRHLIAVSPMLAGWEWSEEWIEQWKTIGRAARSGDMDCARTLWFQHPLFAPVREGKRAEELWQAIAQFRGEQWVRDDQRAQLPMVDMLHSIPHPTLLLTGALDLPDFRLMADLIEAAVPNVTRFDDPTAGHLLTLERPTAIAGAIARFLEGQ